jgi:hypothetical protein
MNENNASFERPPRLQIKRRESEKSFEERPPLPTNKKYVEKQPQTIPLKKSSSLSSSNPNDGLMENTGTIKNLLNMGVEPASSPKLRKTRSELFASPIAGTPIDNLNSLKTKINEIADPHVLHNASGTHHIKTKDRSRIKINELPNYKEKRNSKKKPSTLLEPKIKSTQDVSLDVKSPKKKKHSSKDKSNEIQSSPAKSKQEVELLSPLFNHVGLQPHDFKVIIC